MIDFDLSLDVIPRVINELDEAEQYIKIAIFQLHNHRVFDILRKKLDQGLKVEILTLPYDSIHEDIQMRVRQQFQTLENKGAMLHFCKWNIGDPERTTTAIGRWYSFHGKFIVTDKVAISLSANFTNMNELDAILIFKGDQDKLIEFNKNFDELLDIFVRPTAGHSGKIRFSILDTNYPNSESLFNLPRSIETVIHKDHWITDYPAELCPEDLIIKDELYICPFDIRGRDIVNKIIQNAKSYLYISTESFTDPDIYNDLIAVKLEGIDIKILTGATSMDFSDRIQKMLRNLIASGIKINTTEDPLHAKLIITDNCIAVSSINLNKINLGFARSPRLWRENTETITISSNIEIVNKAKSLFDKIFNQTVDITIKLAERIERDIGIMFNQFYGIQSRTEVKRLFSRFIISEEIDVKKVTLKIGKIAKELIRNRKTVEKNDFVMALILHILSDNKLKYNQIEQKLSLLNTQIDLEQLLSTLIIYGYVEREEDYYKLRVFSLF